MMPEYDRALNQEPHRRREKLLARHQVPNGSDFFGFDASECSDHNDLR